jgi:YVTN family beta-propeller protein
MTTTKGSKPFLSGVVFAAVWGIAVGCAGPAAPSAAPPTHAPLTALPTVVTTVASPLVTAHPTTAQVSPTAVPEQTFPPNTVTEIDLPDLGGGLTVVEGALWESSDSGAVRVEPATGSVSEPISGITNTAFADGHLWAGGQFFLKDLDPTTGEVLREFELENSAYYLAVTANAIWATDTLMNLVQRIDPATGDVIATIEAPSTPKGTTYGEGSVWVACDGAAKVIRIDPETNEFVEIDVGNGPHNIAVGGGWVWVTNRHDYTLSKIDPATNTVVATIEGVAQSPAVGVVAGDDSVWVAFSGGVAEIDPESALVTRRYMVPATNETAFYDLEILGGQLWASDAASPTLFSFDLP